MLSELTLVPGTGGVYDLACDGAPVYSKHALGHKSYPADDEVLAALRAVIGPEVLEPQSGPGCC